MIFEAFKLVNLGIITALPLVLFGFHNLLIWLKNVFWELYDDLIGDDNLVIALQLHKAVILGVPLNVLVQREIAFDGLNLVLLEGLFDLLDMPLVGFQSVDLFASLPVGFVLLLEDLRLEALLIGQLKRSLYHCPGHFGLIDKLAIGAIV